jgi:hypothetical protein
MGEFLRAAFAGLPTVTTHPLTLVGYAVAVLAWLIIAWRVKRNKNLLQNLDKLPESERIDALKVEMGHVPIKEGLSPEQYLRSRIHSFYFLGFVILCVLIATVFIVSAVIGREKEGAANVEVGLYDQDSVASLKQDESGAKFVKDSNRQSAPVVVENDEPPRNKDIYEQNILKYTYDRVDDKKIQITPEMPYLSLLRQEGPTTDLPSCRITFPRLSIKVVNNTNRTLVISEVAINIRSSTVITLPILSVSGSDSLPARELYFNNEGWGDLLSPTVEYNLADMDSCEKVDFADTKYTSQLPTIVSSTHLDISQAIMDFKSPSPSRSEDDPLKGSFVCVFGKVNYGTRSGTSRIATLEHRLLL